MQIYEKRGCLPEWFGVVKAGCPRNQYPEEAGEKLFRRINSAYDLWLF